MYGRLTLVALAGLLSLPVPAEVQVRDPWVRALPPTQPATAAYLTLVNSGPEDVTVVAGSADIAGRVEIHRTAEVDGLMRMEQVQALPLAAGEELKLAPGATHLMLLDLERMPAEGDNVFLCLELSSAEEVCTGAPVRKSAEGGHHHHHHHQE